VALPRVPVVSWHLLTDAAAVTTAVAALEQTLPVTESRTDSPYDMRIDSVSYVASHEAVPWNVAFPHHQSLLHRATNIELDIAGRPDVQRAIIDSCRLAINC